MSHDHSHEHHRAAQRGSAFALATALNAAIVIAQLVFGFAAHSTALVADAAHNAGDVAGLLLAWGAYHLAKRAPTERFTYGLRSGTVLAALGNAMLLLLATGAIAWEALRRIAEPVPVESGTVIVVAAIAILLNAFSAWLLSGSERDANVKGAFWHLVADAAVSAGVVAAAILTAATGAQWIDPAAGIAIAAAILWSTWGLLREALDLSFQAVPASIDLDGVRGYLAAVPGVVRVHDLHIWPLSTTETALTCHFVVRGGFDAGAVCAVTDELDRRFRIGHATIQLEDEAGKPCRLAAGTV